MFIPSQTSPDGHGPRSFFYLLWDQKLDMSADYTVTRCIISPCYCRRRARGARVDTVDAACHPMHKCCICQCFKRSRGFTETSQTHRQQARLIYRGAPEAAPVSVITFTTLYFDLWLVHAKLNHFFSHYWSRQRANWMADLAD